ncbi:regulatory YrvL family protein [Robertmurraya andreesenii]|uniref:Regulatory protein YrvL n=1 Tax=Anoxybacillus andreesenii TaxID=1325932 RepID=A0ABT9V1A1_9BACL|nr:regulatory YrvL family protein [Robertmurraya andreesenii]MDQ0154731.1 hypothetical protein [Robertmurraya andreesenii]
MPEQNDDSFKNMNLKDKVLTVIGIALLIILVLGFVFGIYYFGFVGIFELLGVQYQSFSSLAIFVVCFFILGIFVDLFFGAMAKVAVENETGRVKSFCIELLLAFTSNWLVLFSVDAFMESITLSLKAKLIVSFLLALLEVIFDNKKKSSLLQREL